MNASNAKTSDLSKSATLLYYSKHSPRAQPQRLIRRLVRGGTPTAQQLQLRCRHGTPCRKEVAERPRGKPRVSQTGGRGAVGPHRLMARTAPFHGVNPGSIPGGATENVRSGFGESE